MIRAFQKRKKNMSTFQNYKKGTGFETFWKNISICKSRTGVVECEIEGIFIIPVAPPLMLGVDKASLMSLHFCL